MKFLIFFQILTIFIQLSLCQNSSTEKRDDQSSLCSTSNQTICSVKYRKACALTPTVTCVLKNCDQQKSVCKIVIDKHCKTMASDVCRNVPMKVCKNEFNYLCKRSRRIKYPKRKKTFYRVRKPRTLGIGRTAWTYQGKGKPHPHRDKIQAKLKPIIAKIDSMFLFINDHLAQVITNKTLATPFREPKKFKKVFALVDELLLYVNKHLSYPYWTKETRQKRSSEEKGGCVKVPSKNCSVESHKICEKIPENVCFNVPRYVCFQEHSCPEKPKKECQISFQKTCKTVPYKSCRKVSSNGCAESE